MGYPARDDHPLSVSLYQQRALEDVTAELHSQLRMWGAHSHNPVEWMSVLGEEYGEACAEANKFYWARSDEDRVKHFSQLREELAQVAAVAVAAMEALERVYGQQEATAER